MAKDGRRIRVRIPGGYPTPFCFNLGQRNVRFEEAPLIRGSRLLPWLDALTFVRAPECDLMHTLNAVPIFRRSPFVITFESYLPRTPDDRYIPWLEKFLLKYLALPHCKRLIAFSDYAMGQFRTQIGRVPGYDNLTERAEVLYPAVTRRATKPKRMNAGELRLLFVGRQFMHKGGPAVVRAHRTLLDAGVPVRTTVVSTFDWDRGGLVGPSSQKIVSEERNRVGREGIQMVEDLDNPSVLRLMDEADFLALPTVNDTFGFACIEAMAGGTPVIASNTCALPEIITDGANGFLLDLPTDDRMRWTGLAQRGSKAYDSEYLALMDDLGRQMASKLATVWASPEDYRALSAEALAAVDSKFNHDRARRRLEAIYDDAVRT